MSMRLTRLPEEYAVARLGPADPVPPGFLDGAGFRTAARTPDEVSLVGPGPAMPAGARVETGWACFQVQGPLAFEEVGIVAGLSAALAEARIGIFVVSTFDTDYILVKASDAGPASAAWRAVGHEVM